MVDIPPLSRYPYSAPGWDRRGGTLRTPSDLRGSSGKEVFLGAAGNPARRIYNKMTETPPICDYEGSDYQEAFWEQGGRAYEDAVEAVALKRLLPRAGRRMLELGAGAGRNTLRYAGFEQVTLVDYSRTQLERARNRLGLTPAYRYVSADIYRLPFVDGLFDAATMIRTLHHMSDPGLALAQVRRVLQPQANFILEYANKRNLKSILRYLLRRQDWNPFSPEAVEFAALNFDFHPKAVRSWLKEKGFALQRQLTVSHFRIGIFKRWLPLGLLVRLDSLAQWSGALWQYTPSVFVRAQADGSGTPAGEGAFFACPDCKQPLADTPPRLVCAGCGKAYAVEGGIYDFR
jgi:ubiquinone/menaquinone biosynthesis C-methylase UbiE